MPKVFHSLILFVALSVVKADVGDPINIPNPNCIGSCYAQLVMDGTLVSIEECNGDLSVQYVWFERSLTQC